MKKFFTFMAAALFTATASAQWVVVEDFDSKAPGGSVTLFNVNKAIYDDRIPKGDAKIVLDPTSSEKGKVVAVNCTDYETIVEVGVTLPDNTKLSDYSDIAFDLYYTKAENREGYDIQCYKRVYVKADNQDIYVADNTNILAEKEIKKGEWGTFSTAIPDNNVGSSFALRLGILGGPDEPGTYYIDNIRLKKSSEPGESGTTQNGQIDEDGWLMLQDFEAATLDADFRIWNRWNKDLSDIYEVSLVANPDGGKAAKITYPDQGQKEYDTMFELDVVLPDGDKLTDYSDIAFDLYRLEGDHVGAQMYIDVNGVLIYLDSDYPKFEGADGKWETQYYKLVPMPNGDEPAGSIDGITGSFKLHLGLKSPGPNYMIDNVRLKPATATGITDVQAGAETVVVVDGGVMINAGAKAAYAVYDISGRAVSQGVADGSKTVTLQRGVYVVRVNGKAVKVLVR